MGWLDNMFEYHISQESVDEFYQEGVSLEINHQDTYLDLYKKAKELGQKELAKEAKSYILDSIQKLLTVSAVFESSGKTSISLANKISDQTKKLREIID